VRDVLLGAQRLRVEQVRQVRPLTLGDLREIAAVLTADDTPIAMRDKAIILVGFCSALRSANLAALVLEDVTFSEQGCTLNIRHSKTDQEGHGRLVGIPLGKHPGTCPVEAMRAWIARRGAFPGELFTRFDGHRDKGALQPERFGQIVQACLKRIGRGNWKEYSSHSMRSGLVTEAADAGAGEYLLSSQTGHKDMATLRQYFRRRDVFRNNVCGLLDL
jgi:integrase